MTECIPKWHLIGAACLLSLAGWSGVSAAADPDFPVGEYLLVRDNLYESKSEDLYLRVLAVRRDSSGKVRYAATYRGRFGLQSESLPRLTDVVDRDTWRQLTMFFYRDSRHLFLYVDQLGGGYLDLLESDPENFVVFYHGRWRTPEEFVAMRERECVDYVPDRHITAYASDGERVWYNFHEIEGAEPSRFRVLPGNGSFGPYSTDGRGVFLGHERLENSEIVELVKSLPAGELRESLKALGGGESPRVNPSGANRGVGGSSGSLVGGFGSALPTR